MNKDLVFRQALESEFLELATLRWDARAEGDGEIPVVSKEAFLAACTRFLEEGVADGSDGFFVAARANLLLAQLAVHRIRLFPRPARVDDCMGIITENFTRPAFRNQGIGSRLLRYAIEWARAQDFELLIVYPSERAIPFYTRAGFSRESDVMQLPLRPYYDPEGSNRA